MKLEAATLKRMLHTNCNCFECNALKAGIDALTPQADNARGEVPLTAVNLADALDCFWNAALDATRRQEDSTANAVMNGMVEGMASVAARIREIAATPQPQGDAIPRLANCGRYQATDNTGQTYYLNHANEWQTFQGTQPQGDGFTAADMMDARAEERERLSAEPQGDASPAGWREVIDRARDGLGAAGCLGVAGSGQRELEITIGGALLDHIEDELAALSTPQARPNIDHLRGYYLNPADTGSFQSDKPAPTVDGGAVFGHLYRVVVGPDHPSAHAPWRSAGTVFEAGPAPAEGVKGVIQYRNLYHPAPAPDVARLVEHFENCAKHPGYNDAAQAIYRGVAHEIREFFTAAQQESNDGH